MEKGDILGHEGVGIITEVLQIIHFITTHPENIPVFAILSEFT